MAALQAALQQAEQHGAAQQREYDSAKRLLQELGCEKQQVRDLVYSNFCCAQACAPVVAAPAGYTTHTQTTVMMTPFVCFL